MSLITAHRILIGTAAIFFALFGIWQMRAFAARGEVAMLLVGLVSFVVAAGFGWYFGTIKRRYARRT